MDTLSKEEIAKKLIVFLKEQIDFNPDEQINLESSLVEDLNIDSLDAVNLLLAVEEEFNIDISDEEASKIILFKDAVEYIYNALNNKQKTTDQS